MRNLKYCCIALFLAICVFSARVSASPLSANGNLTLTPFAESAKSYQTSKVYFLPDWGEGGMKFDGTDEKPCTEVCPQKTDYDCQYGTENYVNSCGLTCTRCVECYGCETQGYIHDLCPDNGICLNDCCNKLYKLTACNDGYVLDGSSCRKETCSDNPGICTGGKSCVSGICQCPSGQIEVGGKCETSTCTNNGIKCSGSTGVCNTSTGKCVECLANSDCGSGKECNANSQCIVPETVVTTCSELISQVNSGTSTVEFDGEVDCGNSVITLKSGQTLKGVSRTTSKIKFNTTGSAKSHIIASGNNTLENLYVIHTTNLQDANNNGTIQLKGKTTFKDFDIYTSGSRQTEGQYAAICSIGSAVVINGTVNIKVNMYNLMGMSFINSASLSVPAGAVLNIKSTGSYGHALAQNDNVNTSIYGTVNAWATGSSAAGMWGGVNNVYSGGALSTNGTIAKTFFYVRATDALVQNTGVFGKRSDYPKAQVTAVKGGQIRTSQGTYTYTGTPGTYTEVPYSSSTLPSSVFTSSSTPTAVTPSFEGWTLN